MVINEIDKSEVKLCCFLKSCTLFFLLLVSFPCLPPFTSTPRLLQLHGSWTAVVWAEGRGGWWESEFLGGRFIRSLWGPPLSIAPVSPSTSSALAWEKVSRAPWGVRQGGSCRTCTDDTLRMGMRVCHHGDRQSDRHIEESVAVLPSAPHPPHTLSTTPPPRPHLTLRHQVATCCRSALEPASSAACSVNLRV